MQYIPTHIAGKPTNCPRCRCVKIEETATGLMCPYGIEVKQEKNDDDKK